MRNLAEIIQILRQSRKLTTDADVANLLNIKPKTLATAKARNSIPFEELASFCSKEGLSLDWLLLGGEQAPQGVAEEQEPFDSDFLREIIVGIEEFLKEEGKDLDPGDKAELITMLFTEAQKMEEEGIEASSRAFRLSTLIARFVGSH